MGPFLFGMNQRAKRGKKKLSGGPVIFDGINGRKKRKKGQLFPEGGKGITCRREFWQGRGGLFGPLSMVPGRLKGRKKVGGLG